MSLRDRRASSHNGDTDGSRVALFVIRPAERWPPCPGEVRLRGTRPLTQGHGRGCNVISNEVFVGYLHCRRKAFFKQAGQAGEVADIERVTLQLDSTYARTALGWLLGQHPPRTVPR